MGATSKKHSFWWENTAPDFAFQTQLPQYADVAIIGAGFSGISTAYWLTRLAKKNKKVLRVIVLDEASYPGFKSSGRMNGSVYLGSNHPARYMSDLLGKNTAKKLYNYSSKNNIALRDLIERGIDCDAEFNGGLRMASTAKELVELDESFELLRKWGYYPARFDHSQSQHVMVVPYVKGSLFVPGEGMFDPFAFTNKLARLMRKNNVWMAYGTRVKRAETSEEFGPQLHLSNGHVLTAGKIIHTSTDTAPWDRIQETVIHRREQVIRTEPLSMDLDDMPLPLMPVELNRGLDSVRIHNRSVIMTGGKNGLTKDPEVGITDDTGFNERVLGQLDKTMMNSIPITNHMEVTHAWTYIETEMEDGLPLMGEIPHFENHYINAAHGRNKFGLAFAGAKNIAEKILRSKLSIPEFNIFTPKRLEQGE